MSKYNVNFRDIVYNRLPHFLRTNNLVFFMYAAIKPLRQLNSDTIATNGREGMFEFTTRIIDFLKFNSQTIYLEKYLNDLYDSVNRGIYIETTPGGYLNYLYNKSETATPFYLYNNSEAGVTVYSYNASESSTISAFDFIVYIPSYVAFSTSVITKQINQYKVASKRFNIIIF